MKKLVILAAAVIALGAGLAQPARAAITSTSKVDHWGAFFGRSSATDRTTSPASFTFPAPVADLGTSNSTQYALLTNGTLWAWGQGTNGQLGNGTEVNSFTTPVQVQFPPGVTIASIPSDAMPYDTALAVDTTGGVWGWGLNLRGELCLGTTTSYDVPRLLPLPDVTALAGANGHAVYDSAGTVYSCGEDTDGVLGNGTKGTANDSSVPVTVTGLPARTGVTALVSAFDNDGALMANGAYYDWGMNTAGQLGTGSKSYSSAVPVKVTLPADVTQVTEGGSNAQNGQTLVKLTTGAMYAWGSDSSSQLGNGATAAEFTPVPLVPPAGVTYSVLATGGATSYALTGSGHVYAWGLGANGQIGNGKTVTESAPVMVDTGASMISTTANDVEVAG